MGCRCNLKLKYITKSKKALRISEKLSPLCEQQRNTQMLLVSEHYVKKGFSMGITEEVMCYTFEWDTIGQDVNHNRELLDQKEQEKKIIMLKYGKICQSELKIAKANWKFKIFPKGVVNSVLGFVYFFGLFCFSFKKNGHRKHSICISKSNADLSMIGAFFFDMLEVSSPSPSIKEMLYIVTDLHLLFLWSQSA